MRGVRARGWAGSAAEEGVEASGRGVGVWESGVGLGYISGCGRAEDKSVCMKARIL
jgi:hypothetical protein